MKITCDFCKTEYSADSVPTGAVRCAICGNVWTVERPAKKNSFFVIFAAICALLSALVFTVVVITQHQAKELINNPLIATVSDVDILKDDADVSYFVVSGSVHNRSGDIYGMPDLVIVSWDADGNVISRQKFMPTSTLLDAGTSVSFTHSLSVPTFGVKKISAELQTGDKK